MHVSQAFHGLIWKLLLADGAGYFINKLGNIESAELRFRPDLFVDHLAGCIPAYSSEIETRIYKIVGKIFGVIDG